MLNNSPFEQLAAYAAAMALGALMLFGVQKYGQFKYNSGTKATTGETK